MSMLKEHDEEELILRINNEIQKIRHIKTAIDNNVERVELTSPIDKSFLQCNTYSSILEDRKLNAFSPNRLNPVQDLEQSLQRELEFIHSDLDKLFRKMRESQDLFARLERHSKDSLLLSEASKNAEMLHRDLDVIEKNIQTRFLKEKKELKMVITTLFPDNLEIQDLIAEITSHYFTEGPDKYLQLETTDNIAEQIELLLRTELFEVNPHNQTQIKLIDLL